MEQLKQIILFISSFATRVLLAFIFVMAYAVSVTATPNSQNILERLIDGLFSGEVLALILAGVVGFFVNRARMESERRKEESVELGRLRFKQENHESTKQAVQEGLIGLYNQIQPRFSQIDDTLDDLRARVERTESTSQTALRKVELVEKMQKSWLSRAEEKISVILSADTGHPSLIKNLFYDKGDEPEDSES